MVPIFSGKESTVCIERASEVAGIGEGSPSEETGHGYPPVHAGIGDGSSQGSSSEDQNV